MNKLSKIFLIINIILIIAIGVMTYLYFDMRTIAETNFNAYVDARKAVLEIEEARNQNSNTEQVN